MQSIHVIFRDVAVGVLCRCSDMIEPWECIAIKIASALWRSSIHSWFAVKLLYSLQSKRIITSDSMSKWERGASWGTYFSTHLPIVPSPSKGMCITFSKCMLCCSWNTSNAWLWISEGGNWKVGGEANRKWGTYQQWCPISIPQVVDGASCALHYQSASSEQSDVCQRDGWGRVWPWWLTKL